MSISGKVAAAVAGLMVAFAAGAQAATINVLWTGGNAAYNANVQELSTEAPGFDPDSDGSNTWNLTIWDHTADPNPNFGNYDVLVVGSTSQSGDFFGLGVSAQGVLNNKAAIEAARGNRTFLSGQDADWHDANNRQDQDDGPKGFLINAVNWAASGTGLGIVSMTDGHFASANNWWLRPESFLADELAGTVVAFADETVFIGAGQDGFPVNEGLTSAGLSNWQTSSHSGFSTTPDGYVAINFEGPNSTGRAITIVTEGQEDGGTTPIPAPGAALIFGLAVAGLFLRRHAAA